MRASERHEVGSPSREAGRVAAEARLLCDDGGGEGAGETARSRHHPVGTVGQRRHVRGARHVLLSQPQQLLDGEGRASV